MLIAAAAPLLLGARSAPVTTLSGIRFGATEERTRVVLEFSRPGVRYRIAAADDTSLVLRCRGAQVAKALPRTTAGEGRVSFVRVGTVSSSDLAIHLRLRLPSTPKVFVLGADAGRPARLVVDLEAAPGPPPPGTPAGPEARPIATPRADAGTPGVGGGDPRVSSGAAAEGRPSGPAGGTGTPVRASPFVVVIDPGHGGHDPGATAKGLQEKEVCLDVARRVTDALNRAPGYRAHLTRSDDRFVSLAERMRFAERQDADLFVSVHVNAARNRSASGAEVFFLSIGAATDRVSRELARLENEADPDYVIAEDQELRGLPFAVDLRQSDTMMRSSRIAEVVLDLLAARRLAEPRGVKQAGFAVLKSFQVPSILVELGFISSQADRKKLQTKEHRAKLADALVAGIREYFEKYAPLRATGASAGGR